MIVLTIGNLTLDTLNKVIGLQELEVSNYPWLESNTEPLSSSELTHLEFIRETLLREPAQLLNEATIWSRAIFPLLVLSEVEDIRARAQVLLNATFKEFSITGIADGVLGKAARGRIIAPYLVVVEAKRGIGAEDPIAQLYGELLAIAKINQTSVDNEVEVFGCYTVADVWTFVRAQVSHLGERPFMQVEFSNEFNQGSESEIILKVLKNIVNKSYSAWKNRLVN